MALKSINKNFKNNGKDIKYLNKDFSQFKENLIEYTKTYFPKTYNDFSDASPGTMFIDMASYVGDVLSYYIDDTFKQSLMMYADDIESVIPLSRYLGYKPKVTTPSTVKLSVYQLIPSIGIGANNKPDEKYYLRIKSGMISQSSDDSVQFYTVDIIDFSDETNREISVYQRDATTGEPSLYLIKKYVDAVSGNLITKDVTFGNYSPYQVINLDETNVIQIIDVRDSNNNKYYEVPYLAQEMVFIEQPNIEANDPDLYQFKSTVPYILKTIKTPKRFVTVVNADSTTSIQFGAGDPTASDELLIPNLKNVGLGLPNSISRLEESFDPTNFLKTKTYGTSPSNTTITVKYLVGGGTSANVGSQTIRTINKIEYDEDLNDFNSQELALYLKMKNSVAIDNDTAAIGGKSGDTLIEIKENAIANFASQNRAVTAKDYQIRVLSMPTKFGSIAKAFATADGTLDNNSPSSILASPNHLQEFTNIVMGFIRQPDADEPNEAIVKEQITKFLVGKTSNENEKNNPFAINLYLMAYDNNGNLTNINRALKENIKTYLNEYKILTDGVNLLDGFVINIGVDFEVICYSDYNKSEILINCINELKDYFSIDNWTFNQTINLSEIELLLANVEGVQSVPLLKITNKCGGYYAPHSYNIEAATKDKIVYPSLDPSVFEIKFPDKDIKGRVR
jgi:hypothetical protein